MRASIFLRYCEMFLHLSSDIVRLVINVDNDGFVIDVDKHIYLFVEYL